MLFELLFLFLYLLLSLQLFFLILLKLFLLLLSLGSCILLHLLRSLFLQLYLCAFQPLLATLIFQLILFIRLRYLLDTLTGPWNSTFVSGFSLTYCGSFYCVLFRRMSTALSTWRGLNFDSIFLMRIFSIVSAHLSIGPVPNIVLRRSSTTSMHTLYGSGRSTLTVDRSSMTVSVTFL